MSAEQKNDARVQPAHRVQRNLAVGAAIAAAALVVWGVPDSLFSAFYVITSACVAVPLFFRHRAESFVRSCVIVGLSLLPWGVLGLFGGVFLFWPSALLLLLAALWDPRRRPAARLALGLIGALAVPAVALGTTSYAWHFRLGPAMAEPDAFYRAETGADWADGDFRGVPGRLQPYGATSVVGSESDEGFYLVVHFEADMPVGRRAELRRQIARQPGIESVKLHRVRG
ncbi:hypothetical protein ACFVFI_35005 [Streptomyces sp. NPDC057705]|uniref:hypothetical protein n=1 Tax=Streptomyces sp. NPDC057705 TaxID=3346222 RepID=UPI0036C26B2D